MKSEKDMDNKNIMIDTLIQLLNTTIETEVLEFKEAKNQFDKNKLGKYFSALSNEANLKISQKHGYCLALIMIKKLLELLLLISKSMTIKKRWQKIVHQH